MRRLLSFIMYVLWITTVVFILATTFTDFKYEDLNMLAMVSLIFAVLNTVFLLTTGK